MLIARSFGGNDPMYTNGQMLMPDASGGTMGDPFSSDFALQDSLFGFLNANAQ